MPTTEARRAEKFQPDCPARQDEPNGRASGPPTRSQGCNHRFWWCHVLTPHPGPPPQGGREADASGLPSLLVPSPLEGRVRVGGRVAPPETVVTPEANHRETPGPTRRTRRQRGPGEKRTQISGPHDRFPGDSTRIPTQGVNVHSNALFGPLTSSDRGYYPIDEVGLVGFLDDPPGIRAELSHDGYRVGPKARKKISPRRTRRENEPIRLSSSSYLRVLRGEILRSPGRRHRHRTPRFDDGRAEALRTRSGSEQR